MSSIDRLESSPDCTLIIKYEVNWKGYTIIMCALYHYDLEYNLVK